MKLITKTGYEKVIREAVMKKKTFETELFAAAFTNFSWVIFFSVKSF